MDATRLPDSASIMQGVAGGVDGVGMASSDQD
jgi:hypothetical protein